MASTVTTRPNHYAVLGIEPDASEAEIARAFAQAMSPFRPRAFGGLAEVSVAYETLRDPERRRAYDLAIGIAPAPEPEPAVQPDWKPFLIRAAARQAAPARRAEPAPFIAADSAPAIASPPEPTARDPRLDVFAALAAPGPLRQAAPEPVADPQPAQAPAPEEPLGGVEDGAVDWKRTAAIGGGLVAAVGLVGAWAGWQASASTATEPAKPAVTVPLPRPAQAQASAAPAVSALDAPAPAAERARVPARTPERAAPQRASGERLAEVSRVLEADAPAAAAAVPDAPAAEASAPVATAAAMPLSNAVIARTIGRIGYACGEVASTSLVDGAAGVFKVTCTSGHSYQARPVRGRYHFRRLGGG
jgi:hypothetical protein